PDRSGQGETGVAQQPRRLDQWQPDERGRVAGLDCLEQGDAEALGLEAAGAVERLFMVDIAADLAELQRAKPYHRGIQRKPGLVAVGDADTGMERDRAAGHRLQLPDRAFAVA